MRQSNLATACVKLASGTLRMSDFVKLNSAERFVFARFQHEWELLRCARAVFSNISPKYRSIST